MSDINCNDQHWQLAELETLAVEIRHFLLPNPDVRDDRNISSEIEELKHWLEYYHQGRLTDEAFCQTATVMLSELHDRLKLAVVELQRLEDEGGAIITREQSARNESLLGLIRRMEKILDARKQEKAA